MDEHRAFVIDIETLLDKQGMLLYQSLSTAAFDVCQFSCLVFAAVLPGHLNPPKCTCSGEGLSHALAGQVTSFKIHTMDCYGHIRTQGGDAFSVSAHLLEETASDKPAIEGKVEDLGQGLYRAAYTAKISGSYEVSVTALDGRAHAQSRPQALRQLACLHGFK